MHMVTCMESLLYHKSEHQCNTVLGICLAHPLNNNDKPMPRPLSVPTFATGPASHVLPPPAALTFMTTLLSSRLTMYPLPTFEGVTPSLMR